MASAEQMVRVVALGQALASSPRGVVLRRFAEQRGWPIRYVHRDLKTLERAGLPIEGEQGRYRLAPDFAPRIHADVDAEELLALFVARELGGALRGTSFARALNRLWAKIGANPRQGQLLPATESPLVVRAVPAIDYAPHRAHIATIERAISRRETVSCRYRRPRTGEITQRDIEPGELYFDPGLESMYCIAWCRLRQAVRVFAVHRFLEVRATGEKAPLRPETRSRVALRRAFRVWRSDNVATVRLQFAPEVANEIAERRWHASQAIDATVDGGLVLTMEVAEPGELERWLLGFGAEVTILEPLWLADRVRQVHATAAAVRPAPERALRAGDRGSSRSRRQERG